MSLISLPFSVGSAFILRITLINASGEHLVTPTIADGDLIAQFGEEGSPPTVLTNKHAASPGANQFRSDVQDGFVDLHFAATDAIHHDLRVACRDLAGAEWVSWQQHYRLQFKSSDWDGDYLRFLGYDDVTVVAHKVGTKYQVSNGDSPETFTDHVKLGPLVYGPIP